MLKPFWNKLTANVCFCFSEASKPILDEVSILTAIALFLLSASSEIIGVQSLQNGCMNRFRSALNSSDPWVRSCYGNVNDMQPAETNRDIFNTFPQGFVMPLLQGQVLLSG